MMNFSLYAERRTVDARPTCGAYRGGIGTYRCRMRHIHIDSGPRMRWSKCA